MSYHEIDDHTHPVSNRMKHEIEMTVSMLYFAMEKNMLCSVQNMLYLYLVSNNLIMQKHDYKLLLEGQRQT